MLYESEYLGVLNIPDEGYLMHHGIKGQKWYRRRFQNEDGTLTAAGKARYGEGTSLDDGRSGGNSKKSIGIGARKKAGEAKKAITDAANARKAKSRVINGVKAEYYNKRAEKYKKVMMVAGGIAVGTLAARYTAKHISNLKDSQLRKTIDKISAQNISDYQSVKERIAKGGSLGQISAMNYRTRAGERLGRINALDAQRKAINDEYTRVSDTYRKIGTAARNVGVLSGALYLSSKHKSKKARKKATKR